MDLSGHYPDPAVAPRLFAILPAVSEIEEEVSGLASVYSDGTDHILFL